MSWARKLLGLEEAKALGSPRPWLGGDGALAEPPMGYAGQVRAAMGNPVALRAIRLVAEGLSSVTLSAGGEEHPAVALLPPALLEQVATHLLLHGNAYLETGLDAGGRAATLWALRPERVQLETDARGWPVSWIYRVGGHVQRMPVSGDAAQPGLLHLKALDPLDDHLGTGCVGAASEGVALLQAAGRWNRSLIANPMVGFR